MFALASFHGLNNISDQYLQRPAKVTANISYQELYIITITFIIGIITTIVIIAIAVIIIIIAVIVVLLLLLLLLSLLLLLLLLCFWDYY